MEIRDLTLEEWNGHLPSSGFEAFHTSEALGVVDEYAKGNLRLLGGFRGEQPIGLFPVFVREQWSLTFLLSPPPGLSIPQLGPVLMPVSPKQRKREEINRRFTEAVLDELNADATRSLFGIVGNPGYVDPRPYRWAGFDVNPRYSYVVDLAKTDKDELLDSFTSSLRREIRDREDLDVLIGTEGSAEAERIRNELEMRHAEQGLTYPTPQGYTGELVDALGDRARVYVARSPDGEFLSGIVVLYSNDEARFWQGGVKASYEGVSVNSLLHWTILEDILDDPDLDRIERYDLGSANNARIAKYKSKFNAELVTNYGIKSDLMKIAEKAYSIRRHVLV